MTIAEFIAKYNNSGTGLFRAGQTNGIGSDDIRELVTDITSLSDIPITGSFEFGVTSTSKTLAAVSKTYIFTGTSAANWDLPTPTSNSGIVITIKNRGTQNITLDSNSGSQIYGGAAQASLTIGPGEAYTLLCDGTYFNIL